MYTYIYLYKENIYIGIYVYIDIYVYIMTQTSLATFWALELTLGRGANLLHCVFILTRCTLCG